MVFHRKLGLQALRKVDAKPGVGGYRASNFDRSTILNDILSLAILFLMKLCLGIGTETAS